MNQQISTRVETDEELRARLIVAYRQRMRDAGCGDSFALDAEYNRRKDNPDFDLYRILRDVGSVLGSWCSTYGCSKRQKISVIGETDDQFRARAIAAYKKRRGPGDFGSNRHSGTSHAGILDKGTIEEVAVVADCYGVERNAVGAASSVHDAEKNGYVKTAECKLPGSVRERNRALVATLALTPPNWAKSKTKGNRWYAWEDAVDPRWPVFLAKLLEAANNREVPLALQAGALVEVDKTFVKAELMR
jgi:hypothetical protein